MAPITRTARSIPVEVSLDWGDGMPVACVVNADDLLTIPKALLNEKISVLSGEKMGRVARAIVFALDLEPDLEG